MYVCVGKNTYSYELDGASYSEVPSQAVYMQKFKVKITPVII